MGVDTALFVTVHFVVCSAFTTCTTRIHEDSSGLKPILCGLPQIYAGCIEMAVWGQQIALVCVDTEPDSLCCSAKILCNSSRISMEVHHGTQRAQGEGPSRTHTGTVGGRTVPERGWKQKSRVLCCTIHRFQPQLLRLRARDIYEPEKPSASVQVHLGGPKATKNCPPLAKGLRDRFSMNSMVIACLYHTDDY